MTRVAVRTSGRSRAFAATRWRATGCRQVIRRDRLADERIPHHHVVGTDDAGEHGDDEHPGRRQHAREGQDHQERGEHGVGRAHRTQHEPAPEPVAQHPEHRRGQRAEELQRGERGEQQDRPGVDHHIPTEDERLHLERPRCEEVGGPLEAKAADAEGGEDQSAG